MCGPSGRGAGREEGAAVTLQATVLSTSNPADTDGCGDPGTINAASEQIMHPADVERMARRSIREIRRQSAVAIRLALAASASHGNSWFPVTEAARALGSGMTENGTILASRLRSLGVAETRVSTCGAYRRTDARLTVELVSVNHFHGRISVQMMKDLDVYCRRHPGATPLVALLIAGIRVYHEVTSDGLARFIEPEFDRARNPSAATKPLKQMANAGILTIMRDGRWAAQPFCVVAIDHAQ